MRIETSVRVAVPPAVAFRFYGWLDYLRFVSAELRQEWCPELGVAIREGAEYEVQLQQNAHLFTLKFRTIRLVENELYEDEFLTWPIKGGRHLLTFASEGEGTLLTDAHAWKPPWFARAIVARKKEEQTEVFQQRLDNAKGIMERVYQEKGDDAFLEGIMEDCASVGIEPIIPVDRT